MPPNFQSTLYLGLTFALQITSRFDGVIMKLHHEPGEMALVGKVKRHDTTLQLHADVV